MLHSPNPPFSTTHRYTRHRVSDYLRYPVRHSFWYEKTKEHDYRDRVFLCPNCGMQQNRPEHGVHAACAAKCGCVWISWGNRLDVGLPIPVKVDSQRAEMVKATARIMAKQYLEKVPIYDDAAVEKFWRNFETDAEEIVSAVLSIKAQS